MDDRAFIQYRGMRVNRDWVEQIERAQEHSTYLIGSQVYERIAFGEERGLTEKPQNPCPGCAVSAGEYHVSGCEHERCPACHDLAVDCDCEFRDDS